MILSIVNNNSTSSASDQNILMFFILQTYNVNSIFHTYLYCSIYTEMVKEFMDFMLANNVIGVAIGLLIATKVGEVIKSIIEDLVTPLLLAPVFKKMKVDSIEKLSAKWVLYWKLIARLIEFIVVALIVFAMVKWLGVKTP